MAKDDRHTIIVGGGIVGISTAYYLAKRGQRVTVIDDRDLLTSASAGNAGILALGHPPLPRPGLIGQTLKWMMDPGSPLYVPWRFDPALFSWMWRFRSACREEPFRRSVAIMAELGHAAGACYDSIIEEESIECGYERRGWLEVYLSPRSRATGNRDADLLREYGYRIDLLSREELLSKEPAFSEEVVGAALYADSAFIAPGPFLRELAKSAMRHGAALLSSTRVERFLQDGSRIIGVLTEPGERIKADQVVLAAGSWSTELGRAVGVAIPMQPGKGYHAQLPPLNPPLRTAAVLTERHIAATPMEHGLRLAGTVELSGLNLRLRRRRVEMLTEGALPYLPGLKDVTPTVVWCGLRPCTADGLPVIGWAPRREGLFIATGHAKMGMTLGPVTGQLISEWILDGAPSIDLRTMSPTRFA